VIAKQTQGFGNIAQTRQTQTLCSNSMGISFLGKLWQAFRTVIFGALDGLKALLSDAVSMVMDAIDVLIECCFWQVLQIDLKTLKLEALEIKDE